MHLYFSMLAKYDAGSGYATEYLSRELKYQTDLFQLEEIQKKFQETQNEFLVKLVNTTSKDSRG